MPRSPEPTRQKLLDAALELFATKGISGTSQREIRIAAGQRNVNAIQYHFGDLHNLLGALLERERPALHARRDELLAEMHDLRSAGAVIVLPYAEFATGTEHERRVVRFLAQLFEDPSFTLPEVADLVKGEANDVAIERIHSLLDDVPVEVLRERVVLGVGAFVHAAALRARGVRESALSGAAFRRNLTDMFIGSLAAPVGPEEPVDR